MTNKNGFSLIEVLIFVTILGVFFVAAVSITTFNLKNLKIQEHKILATRYADEGIEWLKQNKEDDWTAFVNYDLSAGTYYCLNTLDWLTPGNCDESYPLGTPSFFKRELLITNSGSPVNQVKTDLTVYWKEGTNVLNASNSAIFKLLE